MGHVESLKALNSHWLYRLVKVIYILGFLWVFLLGLLVIYSSPSGSVDYQKSTVNCENGNSSNLAQLQNSIGSPSYGELENANLGFVPNTPDQTLTNLVAALQSFCANTPSPTQSQTSNYPGMSPVVQFSLPNAENFTLSISTKVFTLSQTLYALVWLILIVIFFELFRRIFYYIVLGKFYPKSS